MGYERSDRDDGRGEGESQLLMSYPPSSSTNIHQYNYNAPNYQNIISNTNISTHNNNSYNTNILQKSSYHSSHVNIQIQRRRCSVCLILLFLGGFIFCPLWFCIPMFVFSSSPNFFSSESILTCVFLQNRLLWRWSDSKMFGQMGHDTYMLLDYSLHSPHFNCWLYTVWICG